MKFYILTFFIVVAFTLTGCNETSAIGETNLNQTTQEQSANQQESTVSDQGLIQLEYPTNDLVGDDGDTIFVESNEIFISQSGRYEFSGDYTEIVVNVDKNVDEGAVYLVLNNANITNETGTPINIIEAKDVVLVLEGQNTVTQGSVTTDDTEFPSAAVYSAADTVITGDGSLTVTTEYQDGINSRDDLIIEGGTIVVDSVEDGIVGKDLLAISGSEITVECGKDGIKSSNDEDLDRGNIIITSGNFNIIAQNDAISAEQILQIEGGQFTLFSGGGYVEVLDEITMGEGSGNVVQPSDLLEDSMKGIKANDILINGGDFIISAYEDAVHANNNVTVNGGDFTINSGDDALHADFDMTINDIDLTVENGYEGIEGSTITINGGEININVLDDAINASADGGFVKITDGTIYLKCMGDGIDSNGDLTVEGGDIVIDVDAIHTRGDGDLDVNGIYIISGGSVTDEDGNPVEAMTQGAQSGQGRQPGQGTQGGGNRR